LLEVWDNYDFTVNGRSARRRSRLARRLRVGQPADSDSDGDGLQTTCGFNPLLVPLVFDEDNGPQALRGPCGGYSTPGQPSYRVLPPPIAPRSPPR
jgi:hypothetical protein